MLKIRRVAFILWCFSNSLWATCPDFNIDDNRNYIIHPRLQDGWDYISFGIWHVESSGNQVQIGRVDGTCHNTTVGADVAVRALNGSMIAVTGQNGVTISTCDGRTVSILDYISNNGLSNSTYLQLQGARGLSASAPVLATIISSGYDSSARVITKTNFYAWDNTTLAKAVFAYAAALASQGSAPSAWCQKLQRTLPAPPAAQSSGSGWSLIPIIVLGVTTVIFSATTYLGYLGIK